MFSNKISSRNESLVTQKISSSSVGNLLLKLADLARIPEVPPLPLGYSIETRKAHDDEHQRIVILYQRAFGLSDGDWNLNRVRSDLVNDNLLLNCVFIYHTERNGVKSLAGCGAVKGMKGTTRDTAYICGIAVDPEHQGNKLATAICIAALKECRDSHDCETAMLETQDTAIAAIKTFLRLNFKPVYVDDAHRTRWNVIYQQHDINFKQ